MTSMLHPGKNDEFYLTSPLTKHREFLIAFDLKDTCDGVGVNQNERV